MDVQLLPPLQQVLELLVRRKVLVLEVLHERLDQSLSGGLSESFSAHGLLIETWGEKYPQEGEHEEVANHLIHFL